jgi:hypothetical protein
MAGLVSFATPIEASRALTDNVLEYAPHVTLHALLRKEELIRYLAVRGDELGDLQKLM